MALEERIILKVDTQEGVTSVQDLRDNIKAYKEQLAKADIGSQDYAETLDKLKLNQNALKDAMYATKLGTLDAEKAMRKIEQSASGAGDSYNALVHRMASLKEEFRATEDVVRRAELGKQINGINEQLKELDALQGNFQRNVGNYAGSLKAVIRDIPKFANPAKDALDSIDKSASLLSKNPMFGVFTLLVPLLVKITDGLKSNESAMQSVEKAMKALQPVFDIVEKVIEKLAEWLGKAVDYFVDLAGESGDTFRAIIAGAVGVGNVLLQYILTPVKTIINAFKGLGNILKDVFTGEFAKIKDDATVAFNGIKDAFVNGFSFKENFELGKRVGEQFASGLGRSKPKVEESAKEIGDTLRSEMNNVLADFDKALAKGESKLAEARKFAQEQEKAFAEDFAREQEEVDALVADAFESIAEHGEETTARLRMTTTDMMKGIGGVATSTASLVGSLADAYEASVDATEKSAKELKNLRIAEAVVQTLAASVAAFAGITSATGGFGIAVAAVQAAAVLTAGYATIRQIMATDVSRNGSVSASVSAPEVSSRVPVVGSVTGASDEQRLNNISSGIGTMAQSANAPIEAYIVDSVLQAKQKEREMVESETTF